jgi:hypothetical protein
MATRIEPRKDLLKQWWIEDSDKVILHNKFQNDSGVQKMMTCNFHKHWHQGIGWGDAYWRFERDGSTISSLLNKKKKKKKKKSETYDGMVRCQEGNEWCMEILGKSSLVHSLLHRVLALFRSVTTRSCIRMTFYEVLMLLPFRYVSVEVSKRPISPFGLPSPFSCSISCLYARKSCFIILSYT